MNHMLAMTLEASPAELAAAGGVLAGGAAAAWAWWKKRFAEARRDRIEEARARAADALSMRETLERIAAKAQEGADEANARAISIARDMYERHGQESKVRDATTRKTHEFLRGLAKAMVAAGLIGPPQAGVTTTGVVRSLGQTGAAGGPGAGKPDEKGSAGDASGT